MNIIEVKNLSKQFLNKNIFRDFNFSAKKGEITAIVGPSGQGKSTFLRILVGLEKADNGTIQINGKNLLKDGVYNNDRKEISDIFKDISMVFQEHNLFFNLTVIDNLKIVKEDMRKINNLLEDFGLAGKENMFPAELSGGQKQRLSIIRSLLLDPKIILFDEPTSSLDSENRVKIANILNKLKEDSYTVVVVTHDERLLDLVDPIIYRIK